MSVLSDLLVTIGLDDSSLEKDVKDTKATFEKLTKGVRHMGDKLTAGITLPIAAGFAFAIGQASDLAEATSAVETTYGDAASGIIDASEKSAEAVGLSQAEYLAASTTLGVFGKMAGKTGDDLAAFGNDSIGAAADLASFYNVPVPDALAAIQSGLMGEYEPLRKFGILLSEATLQQFALENGLWDGVDAMTESEKVAARQAYITEHMGDAAGDFARTSQGLANQMRILKARFKDIAAQFGKILIPYMIKGTKYLSKFANFVEGLSDKQKKWAIAFLAVAAAIGPVLIGLSLMLPALLVLTGPIGLIVLALAALGTAYALNLYGFRDAVNATGLALWAVIKPVIAFGAALIEVFRSGDPVKKQLEQFPGILRPIIEPFLLVADAIGDLVAAFKSGGLSGLLKALPGEIKQIANAFIDLHKAVLDLFLQGLKAAWPYVKRFLANIPGWALDAIGYLTKTMVQKGRDLINGLLDGARAFWDPTLKNFIGRLPGAIFDALGKVGSTLKEKGKAILQGFKDGVDDVWGTKETGVQGWFYGLPGRVLSTVPGVVSLLLTLKSKGEAILQGFRDGVEDKWVGLKAWFTGLPSRITNAVVSAGSALFGKGKEVVTGLIDGINARWNDAVSFARSLAAAIWAEIRKPIDFLDDWIPGDGIPGFDLSMNKPGTSAYGSTSFAPSAATMTGGTMVTNYITIEGYNRDPNELARILARDIALTIGAT